MNVNGTQLVAIMLDIVGILLVVFGFLTEVPFHVETVNINGVYQDVSIVPNANQATKMIFMGIIILIVALITIILTMRSKPISLRSTQQQKTN